MHVSPSPVALRFFILLALAASVIGSVATYVVLGPIAGIKSTYAVLGLGLAAWIYSADDPERTAEESTALDPRSRLVGKAVFGVLGSGFLMVLFATVSGRLSMTILRAVSLLVCVPIAYLLITFQIRWRAPSGWILSQLTTLFVFPPLLLYVTTGFYFDRGDTTTHVYWTDLVAAAGTWHAIPESSHYVDFPAFHTLLASVSLFGNISAYDAYIAVGILFLSSIIGLLYCVARLTIDDRVTALFVALAITLLAPIADHPTYFYPQAFAVTILFYLLFVTIRAHIDRVGRGAYAILSFWLVVLLVLAHHLTAVLLVPILLAFVAIPILTRWWSQLVSVEFDRSVMTRPWLVPLVTYVVASIGYWMYHDTFIGAFVNSITVILDGPLFSGGDDQDVVPIQVLGQPLSSPRRWDAVVSVLSPEGLSQITLLCLLCLGSVIIIRQWRRYLSAGVILALGITGSVFFLRLPISIPGLNRLALVFTIFTAFVVGIALTFYLAPSVPTSKQMIPALIVLVVLSTTTPVLAANDLYVLHAGPGLWESQPTPDIQREFTDEEMAGLERAAIFLHRAETVPATDWHSQVGMNRFGTETESMMVADGRIETESDLLLYRQRWTDHSLQLIPAQLTFIRVVVDEEWQADLIHTENKVYTTGNVGMLAERENSDALVRVDEITAHGT